ncbi:MAG: DUF503 domain-containing protein [Candidatus Aminicenantes bacterium]|nr:DUF503 domain-containing protein [Candidatus Aminicenantes bacterium]
MIMDLHSRATHSLKEKRHIVTGIKEKLKNKFNISIIESDYQDVWQDIQLAMVMVANSRVMIEKAFGQIEDFVLLNYPVEMAALHKEYV